MVDSNKFTEAYTVKLFKNRMGKKINDIIEIENKSDEQSNHLT